MKKITIILLFVFGAFTVSMAQTTSATPNSTMSAKKDKAALAAQKKSDREAKALAKKQAKASQEASSASVATGAHLNKNGTPDKRFKANKQAGTLEAAPMQNASAAHLNKNGKPDKRFKASKEVAPAATQSQVQNTAPASVPESTSPMSTRATTHVARTNMPKVADKSLGADAKGRTIYQGPRGGKYYINKNGHKEYVK